MSNKVTKREVCLRATKKEIMEELIQTRFRLRNCQETYDREHERLVALEAWVRARSGAIEAYTKAKKEIEYWISKDIANAREVNKLNKNIKAYMDLYGELPEPPKRGR